MDGRVVDVTSFRCRGGIRGENLHAHRVGILDGSLEKIRIERSGAETADSGEIRTTDEGGWDWGGKGCLHIDVTESGRQWCQCCEN